MRKPQQIRLKSFDADFFQRVLGAQAIGSRTPAPSGLYQSCAQESADELQGNRDVEDWLINEAAFVRNFGY
ncbi:hypothetical protein [Bradyrhizobium sp. SZCCHNRI2014]|uniref:hypothetical protein n=1 Tax=Bradyrhizobium sp. SZCCHNRI2014 TaxID=3057285 RepID=UPI0029164BC5|nr:hypothetical protein [Bradyrhizobium sp. SZCCHNRI2014]